MKTATAIRVTSDYRRHETDRWQGEQGPFVNYFAVPNILSVSDPLYKELEYQDGMKYWDKKTRKRQYIVPFDIELCLGTEITATTITLSFSTMARAEVCRDDILEAIDKYWAGNIFRLYNEHMRSIEQLYRERG